MIINSTGSYFPQFVGGGIYGTLSDSVTTETAKRFARMGYVAFVATYRQGWNAASQDVNIRTGELLIASYRGIQDLRSMTRFLRLSAADNNEYGIDPDAIMAMGFGTGGYNVYNNNFLDDPAEVNGLSKFINTSSGNPFLNPGAFGDPDGTAQGQVNIPQNVGAESRINFSVGIGGAMGDSTWIEGEDSERPLIGLHSINDANAPFAVGDVFVPTATGPQFVIRVDGPRSTIDRANRLGVNEPLDDVNQVLRETEDFLTLRSDALRNASFTTRDEVTTTFAVENMYPFVSDLNRSLANEYNWIDSTQLAAAVSAYDEAVIAAGGSAGPTAAQRLAAERASNRNVTNPARAKAVLDTIMMFTTPRAFVALDLGTAADVRVFSGIVDVTAAEVGFEIFPNPRTRNSHVASRRQCRTAARRALRRPRSSRGFSASVREYLRHQHDRPAFRNVPHLRADQRRHAKPTAHGCALTILELTVRKPHRTWCGGAFIIYAIRIRLILLCARPVRLTVRLTKPSRPPRRRSPPNLVAAPPPALPLPPPATSLTLTTCCN